MHKIHLLVHFVGFTTVDAILAMMVDPVIYDSTGILVPGMLVVIVYTLEAVLSSCVLGMPFLLAYNPVIGWAGHIIAFSFFVVMDLP